MKKSLFTLFCLVSLTSIALFNGCKKDEDNPVTPVDKDVPDDIFPLTAGHMFEYSGYFTNQDTETPVANTSAFYNTSWTVGSSATPLSAVFGTQYGAIVSAKNGGRTSASLITDSTLTAPGGPRKVTPIFAYYDSTSKDYYYMSNLGLFFRSSVIKDSANATGVRIDSLRFIKLASPGTDIGGEFTCFEQDYVSYANPSAPTTIKLKITGKWESKQDITVNGMTFSTYYLVISRVASVGGQPVSTGVTAKLWLAPKIGPVKMFLAGDAEVYGNYRELKSKNF
ncbi:MAG: hypothetical protein AB1728_10290 [Bacteroidota bacterium]